MKQINKTEAINKINEFFKEKHSKEEVRKIRKLAMAHQIKLKNLRKKFCKKCLSMNLKVMRIKNKMKTVQCLDCGNIMRLRIK